MSIFSGENSASRDRAGKVESVRSSERARPLSPDALDWMRRFQEAGVEMATDEACRKAISARLF